MSPPEARRAPADDRSADVVRHGGRADVWTVPQSIRDRRERREQLFEPDVVAYLEGLDRRREAARRLQRICEDVPHGHALGCHDPQEMTG